MKDLCCEDNVTRDRVTVEKYLESNGRMDGQTVKPAHHNNHFAPIYKSEAQSNIKQVAEDVRARFSY